MVCGTSLDFPANSKRERFLFFFTPLFLVILGIAIGIEMEVKDPVAQGLNLGGTFSFIYLGAGLLYWVLVRLLRLPTEPASCWYAGMFTLIHLLVCVFLSYNLEILIFGISARKMGILDYNQSRLSLLAAIYLPTLFTGILAVAARARFLMTADEKVKGFKAFILKNGLFLIPLLTFLSALLFMSLQPSETRSAVLTKMVYEAEAADLAIKMAEKALAAKEDFAPLHFLKGSAIIDAAPASYTPAQALYHLQRADALEPDNPHYLYKISVAHDLEHNYEQAVDAASRAVSLQPGDSFLWQHLGGLNLKYRNFPEAVNAYRGALKIDPENPGVLNNLAFTCLDLNVDLPQALEMARKSVELLPGFIFNTDTLAWAYYKNGMFAEALETISPIYSDRNEVSAEVDFHYAMILHANGLLAEPVAALEKLMARPDAVADQSLQKQLAEAKMKILFEKNNSKKGEAVDQNE